MIKCAGLLWFVFCTNLVWATSVEEFAWRAPLSESNEEVQRIEIPLDVVLSVTRGDLGDVAVFDKDGVLLPGWLRQKQSTIDKRSVVLSFHRFSRYEDKQQLSVSTRETKTDSKKITEYQMQGNIPVKLRQLDYIIELTDEQRKRGVTEIELEWAHLPARQLLSLQVDVGNSLDQWQTIYQQKNLFMGDRHNRDWYSIRDLPTGYRYIRLIPAKTVDYFDLNRVIGFYQTSTSTKELVHHAGALQKDPRHPDYYYFSQPSFFPAKAFEFIPAKAGMIKGDLYASHDQFDSKRLIKRNLSQFNIAPSESILRNSPVTIHQADEKHWWFKPTHPLDHAVTLKWFYPRYEYLFLPNGKYPYYLAWGNYEAAAPVNDLKQLLKEEKRNQSFSPTSLQIGERERAGGISRLAPAATLPWMKWVLWFTLITGVVVMALMAWRLYRDMNQK